MWSPRPSHTRVTLTRPSKAETDYLYRCCHLDSILSVSVDHRVTPATKGSSALPSGFTWYCAVYHTCSHGFMFDFCLLARLVLGDAALLDAAKKGNLTRVRQLLCHVFIIPIWCAGYRRIPVLTCWPTQCYTCRYFMSHSVLSWGSAGQILRRKISVDPVVPKCL